MKIRVPATTANLGPGFDILGLSLNLYNYFSLGEKDGKETIADKAFIYFYNYIKKSPPNKKVKITKCEIPISRGLGSSATLIVGGLVLGNELEGRPLSDEELLKLATEIEGHPDNVAPAIFGGLVLSKSTKEKIIYKRYEIDENLGFLAFVPQYELSTSMARKVLPAMIKKEESIENTANTAFLILSLIEKDYKNLKYFLKDNIHEPFRKKLIPDYDNIKSLEDFENVLGVYLSGAGPTMMAISNEPEKVLEKLDKEKFKNIEIKNLRPDNEGYKVLK